MNLSFDLIIILSYRLWQAGAGLITTLLAVHFLSAEEQGWYYSFTSMAAFYTLFELGLSSVLIQVSAHSFSNAHWSSTYKIQGANASYCEALTGRAFHWYGLMAMVFWLLMLPGGYLFFSSQHSAHGVNWLLPWLAICSFTALSLLAIPFLAILEGSGQITKVYALRLLQIMCGSVLCWVTFFLQGGLWATVMAPAIAILLPGSWLLLKRKNLLLTALRNRRAEFDWRLEIWPLQWRLALNWLCGYLLTQINIPLLFHMQGAVVAGKLGLSLAIVNTISLLSQSWLTRRVPAMAQAAACKDWHLLDRTFRRNFFRSLTMFIVMAGAALLLISLFPQARFVQRLLGFSDFTGLVIYTLANQFIGGLTVQLRSFKREPFLLLIVFTTVIAVAGILLVVPRYSVSGMIAVLDSIYIFINIPVALFLWRRYNRDWRV
ncbi:hypothetical protein [Chromobacterium sp. ASV23]|uniref:hypothetical protein n=1 Tax=Chromobacterium sp. ASV23 TaxID=2795110 RepID=UPI0018ED4F5E|nr:hypothetical protein [Chromobacterium sp. ASV23]